MNGLHFPKKLAMLLLFAVLVMALIVSPVAAQDIDMQPFVSEREYFSVQVPAGWQTEEIVPGAALLTANSEAALDRYKADAMPESGDFVVNVGFLPYNIVRAPQVASLNIQYDAAPDVFLQSLLPVFRISEGAAISEAELVSVSDARDVGRVTVLADGREGSILVFHAADGVVAFVSTQGLPGETDKFQNFVYSIAAETDFTVPQNALWGVMVGR